jgi:hypothetical protein
MLVLIRNNGELSVYRELSEIIIKASKIRRKGRHCMGNIKRLMMEGLTVYFYGIMPVI